MPQRAIEITPAGLWTDPNPHSEAPAGALRVADDVILRRPSTLEARPGFATAISGWSPPGATQARDLLPFGADTLILDSGNAARWLSDGDAVSGFSGNAYGSHRGRALSRGRLFVTDAGGMQVLDTSADTAARDAGMPKGRTGGITVTNLDATAGGWTPDGETRSWAYRVVFRRDITTEYKIRGAPSGPFHVTHGTIVSYMMVTASLPAGVVAGDVLELYRTVGSETAPASDDLYLSTEHVITSAEITAGVVDVEDLTPDDRLGESLYTNVGAEGVEASKYRPPLAGDVALFNGSLFFAQATHNHVLRLKLNDLSTEGPRGFGLRGQAPVLRGTTVLGSDEVTITDGDTTDVAVGMLVTEVGGSPEDPGVAGTNIDEATFVTAVGIATITLSKVALAGNVNVELYASPWIEIDGETFYAWTRDVISPSVTGLYGYASNTFNSYNGATVGTGGLCGVVNYVLRGTGVVLSVVSTADDGAEFLLESDRYDDGAVDVRALPGGAWSPNLDDSVATSTAQDVFPHRLMWSAYEEPEAVPLHHFADVGDESAAILRILPTTDALWIVKEDGVYRLTGRSVTEGWRIDARYPTLRPLGPRACCVHDDQVCLWTEQGLVALSDVGISNLSEGPIGATLRSAQNAHAAIAPSAVNTFLRSNDGDHELLLGIATAGGAAHATDLYVYNSRTQAWVRWGIEAFDALEHPDSGKLLIARRSGTDYVVHVEGGAEAFSPVIEWQARSLRDPGVAKMWGRVDIGFDTMGGVSAVTPSFTSDISDTPAGAGALSVAGLTRYVPIPTWVPREHNYSTVLYPKVTITQSTSPAWRLVGLMLQYDPASMRPRRVAT